MPISRFAVPAGVALVLVASVARAETAECVGFDALAEKPLLAIGRIAEGSPRTRFIKNGSDQKGCPDTTDACRAKAFLVPGNRIIVGVKRGAFVCADYIGANGVDRAGWLPANTIVLENPATVTVADWLGAWSREEASITVRADRTGELTIHGDATYGAEDPDRVKRGGVNVGEIMATLAPNRAALAFAMGEDKTLPVGKGQDTDCKVWMQRLGPYLLVDDNNQCGGANVTFRGVYLKKS